MPNSDWPMTRLRLQTQLLVSTLLIICALTGAILLVIRYTIRAQIAEQVKNSTDAAIQEFDMVQLQLQVQLSRMAGVLADIPCRFNRSMQHHLI